MAQHVQRRNVLAVAGHEAWTVRHPWGPCGFIFPWNFPFLLIGWGISPALAAGNTVVIKPAEDTPMSAIYLARLAREIGIPDGVINVIPGTGAGTGAALSAHPGIKRMSFTGSPEVGRLVAESCGRNLVPVKLELGGKDPTYVCDDANPQVAAESVAELVALAKAQPGRINYASVGSGSVVHLATEMFRGRTDIAITHVPYKASPEALQSVVGNQTQMMFVNVQAAAPLIKAGKLRALAIVHPTRSPLFPNLPTIAEAGFPGYHFTAWFGIVAPSSVPRPIVTALNQEINRIMTLPEVRERLANMGGVEVVTGTPERFGALIQSETETWGKLVRQTGAKID
jgi:hypothetical protein